MLIKGNLDPTFVVPCCRVKPELNFGLEATVKSEASAFNEGRADRRMMADLLAVEESTVDCFLEGFAKDRVEWLIAADVASRTSK